MCTSLCGCMHVLMDARRGWQNFRNSVTGCSELPVMGAHVTHDWEQWSKVVKMRGARLPIPSTSWWPSWFIPTAIPQSQMMNGNDPQWAEPLDKHWQISENSGSIICSGDVQHDHLPPHNFVKLWHCILLLQIRRLERILTLALSSDC